MLTEAQIEQRRHGLGSSDVAAVVGLNPYRSKIDVYNVKRGIVEDNVGNIDAVIHGNYAEPGILSHYEDTTGAALTRGKDIGTLSHPDHPWAMATPDAIAEKNGSRWIVEAKEAGWTVAHRWGPAGTEEVPDEYLVQCQWQMFVMDIDRCDLHASVDRQFRTYTIRRNEALIGQLFARALDFWTKLRNGIPPEIDGSSGCADLLTSLYPEPKGERVQADEEAEALAIELRGLYEDEKRIAERKDAIKAKLCERIGDARGMTTSVGTLSWSKARIGTRTDWAAVAAEVGAPDEIVAKHTRETKTARVFVPRWNKENK